MPGQTLPPPVAQKPSPLPEPPPRAAPPSKARPVLVALDPGHGGEDPGAIGPKGTKEKDIVLSIARRLKKLIDAQPNMRRSEEHTSELQSLMRISYAVFCL